LLELRIPLTPSNVIMYLRVLLRVGDFKPLNRVDILAGFFNDLLSKPSDVYRDSFNAKQKAVVLSEFAHDLYEERRSEFDKEYWSEFIAQYQERTFSEFDGANFLEELVDLRIITKFGTRYYFKYSFFFYYFLGRYIAGHTQRLHTFLERNEYLNILGIIEVITGLSADNSMTIKHITERQEALLDEFWQKYLDDDFDPLLTAKWPDQHDENEKVWEPVKKQIEAPAKTGKEIDLVKSSFNAEARTVDQQIRFFNFKALEVSLFFVANVLNEAVKNADDVDGELKVRAVKSILRGHLVSLQIGTMFANEISSSNFFRWGGVGFIDLPVILIARAIRQSRLPPRSSRDWLPQLRSLVQKIWRRRSWALCLKL
jgi:hypothetical protein